MQRLDFRDPEVLAAADRLPETLKLVVTLRNYEEVDAQEAAELLGLAEDELETLHADALEQLRALLNVPAGKPTQPSRLADWTYADIVAETAAAYREYERELKEHYTAYFAGRPAEAGAHPLLARDRRVAFPKGWEKLADDLLDSKAWHRWHLSGRSSQVLAVGLLAPAVEADESLRWLLEPSGPIPSVGELLKKPRFEYELPNDLLGEYPHATTVDFLVDGAEAVLCIEAKFAEDGMGRCRCEGRPDGDCADRVMTRPYWSVAREVFGLKGPAPPAPCSLSFAYQAVRNVCAALALSTPSRRAIFSLVYDENNPYFSGFGTWPGWVSVLEATLADAHPRLAFRGLSWQQLIPTLPLDEAVRAWARDKHRLIS